MGESDIQQDERLVTSPGEARARARLTVDGRRLKELVRAAYLWLQQREEVVNGYNVYPVPDGDTGTNMMHTMRSAWEAIANLDEPNIGLVARAISNGALRGSRGNSGIILSQLWRGFARSLDRKEICDAQDLVAAMKEAAKTAYSGVSTPVEGTILTVARETAEAVEAAAQHTHDLRQLLTIAKEAAYESVQRTPSLLKILREAGVIDSGGYGLFVILEGMWRLVNGMPVEGQASLTQSNRTNTPAHLEREGGWGYDVQYLIYARSGQRLNVEQIRADIEAMGECPLVLGDESIVKVHVHVSDPGIPLSYGARLGSLRDVVVEDMQAQSEAFAAQQQTAPAEETLNPVEVAVIAVASGRGIARAFKEAGVRVVVEGGQTMNPSVEDFLTAIQQAKARSAILLPNNSNILMTAQQAAALSELETFVVPTRTIAQGIAAAIAFNPQASAVENASAMSEAAQRVLTGEITISTRDATIDGLSIRAGQIIGLLDDKLVVAEDTIAGALLALLRRAEADNYELITLFYGNGLPQTDAETIADAVQQSYPAQQIELIAGDQPHYYFIVSIE
jgi:DAK2 domain fusion protein YloV